MADSIKVSLSDIMNTPEIINSSELSLDMLNELILNPDKSVSIDFEKPNVDLPAETSLVSAETNSNEVPTETIETCVVVCPNRSRNR